MQPLALPLLTTLLSYSIADAAPAYCPLDAARHVVLLPNVGATQVPTNASLWVVENAFQSEPVTRLFDGVTNEEITLETITHATKTGVVLQLRPERSLTPNQMYRVENARTEDGAQGLTFVTGSDRDDEAPPTPFILSVGSGYTDCTGYGLLVRVELEEAGIAFAEDPDGALSGFGHRERLGLYAEEGEEQSFRVFAFDIAGNKSPLSATERGTLESPDDDGGWFCTCTETPRSGLAFALALPLLVLLRRRR